MSNPIFNDRNVLAYFSNDRYVRVNGVDNALNVNLINNNSDPLPIIESEEYLKTIIKTYVKQSDVDDFPTLYVSEDCIGMIKTIKIYKKDYGVSDLAILYTFFYEDIDTPDGDTRIEQELVEI